jgi:hypothetical protein
MLTPIRVNPRSSACHAVAWRRRVVLLLLVPLLAFGADYYVSPAGDDANTGSEQAPLRTINKAVALLQPGDTLHLANTGKVYRQSINIPGNISGTAEKKITIDGHGAWLTCAEPLPTERWEPAEQGPEGTLRLTGLSGRYDFGIALLLDGERVKGFDNPDALKPGEFWYLPKTQTLYYLTPPTFGESAITITQLDGKAVDAPPAKWGGTNYRHLAKLRRFRGLTSPPTSILVDGKEVPLLETPALDNLPEGRMCMTGKDALYYRPPAGKTIDELRMMAIFRSSGVAINGANQHLVIKNLNVAYTTNDGYNIHGATKHILFQNCNAFFCGDEGYSAHGKCESTLDRGIFLKCSNGIHNVNQCSTVIRNVIVGGVNTGGLVNDPGTTNNIVENTILIDCPLGVSNTRADNVLAIVGMGLGPNVQVSGATVAGNGRIRLNANSKADFEKCLFAFDGGDMHVRAASPDGIVSFKDCFYDPAFAMEWGTGHPFTRMPFTTWVQDNPSLASHCQATELDLKPALDDGHIPEGVNPGMGCSRELLQRYIDFLPKHQTLLEEAKKIVFADDNAE